MDATIAGNNVPNGASAMAWREQPPVAESDNETDNAPEGSTGKQSDKKKKTGYQRVHYQTHFEKLTKYFNMTRSIMRIRPIIRDGGKVTVRVQMETKRFKLNNNDKMMNCITMGKDQIPYAYLPPRNAGRRRIEGDRLLSLVVETENRALSWYRKLFEFVGPMPPDPIEFNVRTANTMTMFQIIYDQVAWHLFVRGYLDGAEDVNEKNMPKRNRPPPEKEQPLPRSIAGPYLPMQYGMEELMDAFMCSDWDEIEYVPPSD